MTGLFPYGRYALTPRLGLWAIAGHGWGKLSLKPDGEDAAKPNTTLGMAAVGLDGVLLHGGSEGITLTTTADVLTLKTTSAEVTGWTLQKAASPAVGWGWKPSDLSPCQMAPPSSPPWR